MSGKRFSTGQVAQLFEVESALVKRTGLGLGRAVQDVIDWVKNHGGSHSVLRTDPRIRQAMVYWGLANRFDLFGSIGYVSPEQYLNGCPAKGIEPIPPIPIIPDISVVARFQYPVLIDERFIEMVGCNATFKAFGAELYPAYREGVRDVDAERPEYGRVYWMYVQDGRLHHGRTPQGVIDELEGDEKPLTDFQGLCTAIMFPQSLDRNMMILAGSIYDHQGDDDGYSLTSLTRDSGNLRPSWTYHGKAINDECGVATGIIGGLDQ